MEQVLKKLQEIERRIEILQSSINGISSANADNFTKLDKRITDQILAAKTEIEEEIKKLKDK